MFAAGHPTLRLLKVGDMLYLHKTAPELGGVRTVSAIDPANGALRWTFERAFLSAPAVVDNAVHMGAQDGIHVLDAVSGRPIRTIFAGDFFYGDPVAIGRAVYVGGQGGLVALNPTNGHEYWRYSAPVHSIVMTDDTVYGSGQNIIALEATTGRPLWRVDPWEASSSSDKNFLPAEPIVGNGGLYIAAYRTLQALDAATGRHRWKVNLDHAILGMPIVHNDTVFVFCADSVLYALAA